MQTGLRKGGTPLCIMELTKKCQEIPQIPFHVPRYSDKPAFKRRNNPQQKSLLRVPTDKALLSSRVNRVRPAKNTRVHFEDEDLLTKQKSLVNPEGSGCTVRNYMETATSSCLKSSINGEDQVRLCANTYNSLNVSANQFRTSNCRPILKYDYKGPRVAALFKVDSNCKQGYKLNDHCGQIRDNLLVPTKMALNYRKAKGFSNITHERDTKAVDAVPISSLALTDRFLSTPVVRAEPNIIHLRINCQKNDSRCYLPLQQRDVNLPERPLEKSLKPKPLSKGYQTKRPPLCKMGVCTKPGYSRTLCLSQSNSLTSIPTPKPKTKRTSSCRGDVVTNTPGTQAQRNHVVQKKCQTPEIKLMKESRQLNTSKKLTTNTAVASLDGSGKAS